jgi:hypothetical protein
MIVEGEAEDVNQARKGWPEPRSERMRTDRPLAQDMRRIRWVLALILAAAVFAALTPQG